MNRLSLKHILEWALTQIEIDLLNPSYKTKEIEEWNSILFDLAVLAEYLEDPGALEWIHELLNEVDKITLEIKEYEHE